MPGYPAKDLTGQRFGRWTVIKRAENKGKRVCWLCRCDCGNEAVVLGQNLKNGSSKSCGCWNHEKASERMKKMATTHGESKTRLYNIWKGMRKRCKAKGGRFYRLYASRGIKVCTEWDNDFIPFRDWALSHGYADNLELDRIDNDGNYCPENCRWTNRTEQVRNRRVTIKITMTKSLAEWCEIFNIPYNVGEMRYQRGTPLDAPYYPAKNR